MPAEWMRSFLSCDGMPVRVFGVGQPVVVTERLFTGLGGICQLPDGESRAHVLLELLGKPSMAEFPVESLRRVA